MIISIGITLIFTLALPVIATTYYYLELTEQEGVVKWDTLQEKFINKKNFGISKW